MNVKELRNRLAAFDDEFEIYAAPLMLALRVGEDRDTKVPHPMKRSAVRDLYVVSDVDDKTSTIGERYIVLGFEENK